MKRLRRLKSHRYEQSRQIKFKDVSKKDYDLLVDMLSSKQRFQPRRLRKRNRNCNLVLVAFNSSGSIAVLSST